MKLLFPAFCLLACAIVYVSDATPARDTAAIKHIVLDTMEVSAPGGIQKYRAASPLEWNIVHTKLAISFNLKDKTAPVKEWITLHPWCFATDSIVLDAKSVAITAVRLSNSTGRILSYKYAADRLSIKLDRKYTNTETITLYLDYTAQPYKQEVSGSAAITEDRGLYLINTDGKTPYKPAQIWTQGETESNSHWMITNDKPNCRFTTEIAMTVPDSFVTLSNGTKVSQLKLKGGLRTDTWKMDQPIAAYSVMMAAGRFSVIHHSWHNKDINYYVEPAHAAMADSMFNHTAEMVDFFSKKTGVSFPWPKYSQVVVRDYVSGAMENTSASLFGEFMIQDKWEYSDKNNEDVVSHELFHQWFGDYVTCESWSNLTVNESFANYGEQLWRRYKYGDNNAAELAWNDLQRYVYSTYMKDPQLVRTYYDNREQMFDAVTYTKGGAILHYLNTLIGDAAFDKAMQLYLTKNALHSAEAHNWRMAVEEATGLDWNWFFNEWYYHAGHPELKLTYTYDDDQKKVKLLIEQAQDDSPFLYRLPLTFAVINGRETRTQEIVIAAKSQVIEFPYSDVNPPIVIPDVLHVLPGTLREYKKKTAVWASQYRLASDPVSKTLALKALDEKKETDTLALATLKIAMNDPSEMVRSYALSCVKSTRKDSTQAYYKERLVQLALHDQSKTIRAAAIAVASKWSLPELQDIATGYLNDSSYVLAGAALEALYKLDRPAAYIQAKRLLDRRPKSSLDEQIWEIIGDTSVVEDVTLYYNHVSREQGNRKHYFPTSLANYLSNINDLETWEKGARLLGNMCKWETLTSYRSTMTNLLFTAAVNEKEKADGKDSNMNSGIAKARLAILKTMLRNIVDNEPDAAANARFDEKWKKLFE